MSILQYRGYLILTLDCPTGFSYFGEVPVPENERDFWTQGDRTPTYSCYKIHKGPFSDWTNASQRQVIKAIIIGKQSTSSLIIKKLNDLKNKL